jgi:hypothetical protein
VKNTSDQKFKLSPKVSVERYSKSSTSKKVEFQSRIKQFVASSNNATTGYKLQGMSIDAIVVSSWPTGGLAKVFKNSEHVVLS